MITAINEQETIELCAQYGAVDYILKPFQFERFEKSILRFKHQKELLQNSKKRSINQILINFNWTEKEEINKEESRIR